MYARPVDRSIGNVWPMGGGHLNSSHQSADTSGRSGPLLAQLPLTRDLASESGGLRGPTENHGRRPSKRQRARSAASDSASHRVSRSAPSATSRHPPAPGGAPWSSAPIEN